MTLRIGTACVDITPALRMPMAGFGMRADLADGMHDPLTLTAIYLQQGEREVWICAADLCEFPNEPYRTEGIDYLTGALGCLPSSLFLNASHTHGGPQVNEAPMLKLPAWVYQFTETNRRLTRDYVLGLWRLTARACREAKSLATESSLAFAGGKTTFAMNRRRWVGGRIENAPNPEGPVDDRLRLLGVQSPEGKLRALGLLLACHPTSTGPQHRYTADFVAGWREQMRRRLGNEVQFFFLQTCGGDARPGFTRAGESWRMATHGELETMGRHLADETEDVLANGLEPLANPLLRHARASVSIPCEILCRDAAAYRRVCEGFAGVERLWAESCLSRIKANLSVRDSIALDLTLLELDAETRLLGGDCEFLGGMGKKIEAALGGSRPVALGYTNGCVGYFPDEEENALGGYETESYLYEGWSGPFKREAQSVLLNGVRNLCRELR